MHGWGRTHDDFDAILDGFDALALDLPGFGASPAPSAVWGATEYASAVVPILQDLPEPPWIVGHSFGGRVAVCLAADHPKLVAGILVIGAPLVRSPEQTGGQPALAYRLIRMLRSLRLVPEEVLERARRRYGSADYRAASGVMRDILVRVVNETYEDELARLGVPVHFLWGGDDTAAPVSGARLAKRLVDGSGADASLAILPGVGHDMLAERPDKVRAELSMLIGA